VKQLRVRRNDEAPRMQAYEVLYGEAGKPNFPSMGSAWVCLDGVTVAGVTLGPSGFEIK
jgi:hypothetical protein